MPGSGAMKRLIEAAEPEPALRQQLALLAADHLEIGKVHQIEEVGGGDVVDLRLLACASPTASASFRTGSHRCE